jgi:hypothetical protein
MLRENNMKNRLYNFITNTFLVLNYVFITIRIFFIKLRIKYAKNNWITSKKRNFYNSTLEATIYKFGPTWSIARHGNYYGAFELKEEAMDKVLQTWIEDKKITKIINHLKCKLENIKQKISNSDRGDSNSIVEEFIPYNAKEISEKKKQLILI